MYRPVIDICILPQHRKKIPRLAGMLRGLLNSFEGFRAISGLTNAHFESRKHVRVQFATEANAQEFAKVANAVLGKYLAIRPA
jgi:hypothetical protein